MSEINFPGFPKECLQFFKEIKLNNNRQWFEKHKQDYIDYVQTPAKSFVLAFGEQLKTISDQIVYDTRMSGIGSVLRIYRDIRFSKDKTPYNKRLRIVFWEGSGKKMENPSFFIVIDEEGARIHSGLHRFPKPVLQAYREAIVDTTMGDKLEEIIAELQKYEGYGVGGLHYKRVPRGFDQEHPRAELLKFNGLYVTSPMIEPDIVMSPTFLEESLNRCKIVAPLHQWLVEISQ